MRNDIGIYKIKRPEYPSKKEFFRPNKVYMEFEKLPLKECAEEVNYVYEGLRNLLLMLEYDKEHIGTKRWNPFRGIISPGQYIVIKPNLVMHKNAVKKNGEECLYTHPSVVAAVLDYVILAMSDEDGKFSGNIIVGDAPMQSCDFRALVKESGYAQLISYYQKKGYAVKLKDFRNVKVKVSDRGWIYRKQEKDGNSGKVVSLGSESNFTELSTGRMKRLRVTSYDPAILKKHHNESVHEYRIADEILKADVIFNMPKPKTHRKAGVTIAMKNFVGINANKEYLPHHTMGSRKSGKGDEYLHDNIFFWMAGIFQDWKNMAMQREYYALAKVIHIFSGINNVIGRKFAKETYREGSWYGNDTIWRTVFDLNNIILFCDKHGKMRDTAQRNILNIADMIIAGEGDGPVAPVPKECGVIAAGENPALFDEAVCSLMGIDGRKIPSVCHIRDMGRLFFEAGKAEIVSNRQKWNVRDRLIRHEDSLQFLPNPGWQH